MWYFLSLSELVHHELSSPFQPLQSRPLNGGMSYSPPKGQGGLASQASAATTQAQGGAASQRQALDDSLPPPPPVPGNAGQGGGSMLGAPAVPPEHLPPSPPPPPPVPTCPPPEVDPVPGELALIYFLFSKGMDNFNTFKTTTTASKKNLVKFCGQ